MAELWAQRARQLELRLQLGPEWTDLDLVFPNNIGQPLDAAQQTRVFQRLLSDAGLPEIRFHDCRHMSATLLLPQGLQPKVVSKMLRHATITLTLDTYSYLVPVLHQQAASVIDELLGS